MEFPNLGEHCSFGECCILDFLPINCGACGKFFCKDHYTCEAHNCDSSYKMNNQVPRCPLCNKLIPIPNGEPPDRLVGFHIDSGCKLDRTKSKGSIYSNRCSKPGCRRREILPITCPECQKNFCIKHRLHNDHVCNSNVEDKSVQRQFGSKNSARSKVNDQSCNSKSVDRNSSIPTLEEEDEALARAIQESLDFQRTLKDNGVSSHNSLSKCVIC